MRDDSHDNGELPKMAQGLPVAGYQPQSEARVIMVNAFKALEDEELQAGPKAAQELLANLKAGVTRSA